MINIEQTLNTKNYDFLRQNSDLANVCYLVLSGSHGYGTNNQDSDIDLRGFLIEDKKYLYGLKPFEQFEDLPTDTVIYGLKKYVKLCMDANPNALELLGVEDDSIVIMTDTGKLIRDNVDLFLTKRVINSFGNYAMAQLRRLQNALCHDSYAEAEKTRHLQNTLNAQMDHFRKTYTHFEEGAMVIDTDPKTGQLKLNVHLIEYPLNAFVGITSELSNIMKTYHKLNHRNNKKDDAHLYKHAMHLIRLLITGTDILKGNGLRTKRTEEHELLMDIRNGQYHFDAIFQLTDQYQRRFEAAAATTILPYAPDESKIEALLMDIYDKTNER